MDAPKKCFATLCYEFEEDEARYWSYGDTMADALAVHDGEADGKGSILMAEYKLVRVFRAKEQRRIVTRKA